MWVETVTEGGRGFMTAWRKEDVDADRRERQRDWKSCYRTRKRRTCEATPIGLVDEPKESCTGTRRTETCLAPRH